MSDDGNEGVDDVPGWCPEPVADVGPKPQQRTIIETDAYPMRVLAGAGTGKTFTMVRKIEHIIDEREVSPDRILALTFTNNAADSMREKLNSKVGTSGYDVDAYTYHSICKEILSDYAYEAGLDPDFDVVTDAERYAIVLEVLDEVEYRSIKPNVYGPDFYASGAASKLLSFVGSMKRSGIAPSDVDAFLGPAEDLYELAEIPDRVESIASDHLGGRSVSTVHAGLPDVRAELAAERDALGDDGVEAAVTHFLDQLCAVFDSLESAFEEHEAGDRELPDAAHKLPKYLLGGYANGAPTGIPDDLDLELTDRLREFVDDCLAARDLADGYAAYERVLDERDLLDFDGLVVEATALLNTAVGEEVTERWEYVFCDEFQDTDRLQFELVTALLSDGRLFVVGDDDQAIYEWRGAHVANITDELDGHFGAALVDEPLEQNFRSRQPILDLANELLGLLEGRRSEKTLTRADEPPYGGDSVVVVDEAEEEDERADQLVAVVRNLLSGESDELDRAYDPGDIALLVRKNRHATPILEAFDEAGIPYQIAGSLATESVGVGTVVAYLKALARPAADEVSWNRVLTMRYRLTDADLRRLNAHEGGVLDGLLDASLETFDEPERVREAREHVRELLEVRETASLGYLYRRLKEITNVEWYLSEQERRDLSQLDDVIESYGDDAVRPPLTPEFVESLVHYDSLLEESGSTPTSQPELADDAVNVMTIHKSKGLDFPVVLLPRLTADQWKPSSRTYDALETALVDGPGATFAEDFVERDAREARRLLHVAITRAEDVLVLHGRFDEDDASEDERSVFEAVEEILPPSVPWRPATGEFPIWEDLTACLPREATDWTETLASTVVGDVGGSVVHDGRVLSPSEGQRRLLSLANQALTGELSIDGGIGRLAIDELTGPTTPAPSIQHSYTSLAAYEACPRQHYLDYVVNAFEDVRTDREPETVVREMESSDPGVSQRTVGVLFHDTAELAAERGASTPDEWYTICERLVRQRRGSDAQAAVEACIDRYFELELCEWEVIDGERRFELDLDGHELVGFIDAVCHTPDGELVVVDYKATERHRDIDDDDQLPIYLLACRDLYDEPVRRAGYAYVGPIGPKLETRKFEENELEAVREEVTTTMDRIHETTFAEYVADEHCRWCRHNELPCADGPIAED